MNQIQSQVAEEVLTYLDDVAMRAAEVPAYYPAHLRSIERGTARFDQIRQTVRVVQDRELFVKFLAQHRERQRAAGYWAESNAYGMRLSRQDGRYAKPISIGWKNDTGARFRRAVILGDPGLGKTWLLRYEARKIAKLSAGLLRERRTALEDVELPIPLRLSDLNRKRMSVEDAVTEIVGEYRSARFRAYLRQKLNHTGAVLLLDAWDEVGDHEELRGRLETFARTHAGTRIHLTSRIVGYDAAPLPDAAELELLPFGQTEVDAFVDGWFEDEPEKGKRFSRDLRRTQDIAGLARIPLMLALLCRSWDGQLQEFPHRRDELYDLCLWGLLREWKQTKGKKPADVIVNAAIKRLAQGAERLFIAEKEQFTEIELSEALGFDAGDCDEAQRAQRFIDQCKADGILVSANSAETELTFLHRTFQEYLTAKSLSQKPWLAIENLVERKCWLPAWQETIALLAGQMDDPGPLLDILVEEKRDDYYRHRLALAAHCLPELSGTHLEIRGSQVGTELLRFWLSARLDSARLSDAHMPHIGSALSSLVRVNACVDGNTRVIEWVEALMRGTPFPNRQDLLSNAVPKQHLRGHRLLFSVLSRIRYELGRNDIKDQLVVWLRDANRSDVAIALLADKDLVGSQSTIDYLWSQLHNEDCPDRAISAAHLLWRIEPTGARPTLLRELYRFLQGGRSRPGAPRWLALEPQFGRGVFLEPLFFEDISSEFEASGFSATLLNSLQSGDPYEVYLAVKFLGLADKPIVQPTLVEAVFELFMVCEQPLRGTVSDLLQISQVMKRDDLINRLLDAIEATALEIRRDALHLLERLQPDYDSFKVQQTLRSNLRDQDGVVRCTVARMLLRTKPASLDAVNALLELLSSSDPELRSNAVEAFNEASDAILSGRVLSALRSRLEDDSEKVRAVAARTLYRLGPSANKPQALVELRRCAASEDPVLSTRAAVMLLGTPVEDEAVDTFCRLLGTSNPVSRFNAMVNGLEIIDRRGVAAARPELVDLLVRQLAADDVLAASVLGRLDLSGLRLFANGTTWIVTSANDLAKMA